jgi:hypothetical protein
MTGTLVGLMMDYKDNKPIINLKIDKNELEHIMSLKDKKLEIKEYKEKRSLNSNSYLWKLVTEIGNVMNLDKEEVYLSMLKKYGQAEVISILSTINIKPYLKYFEEFGESLLNGKLFKHYKVYMGSSEMDSKQMSILLNGVVEEAKEQGIPTLEDLEIKRMCDKWK